MGIFSKKEPEKKVETETTKDGKEAYVESVIHANINKDYPYVIQLYDIEDNTVLRKKPFGAKRYIDGANVYLVNEKVGFKEPFPKNTDEFKQYNLGELNNKISKHEETLKSLRNNKKAKRVTGEELDIMQEIKIFQSWKRSLELAGTGSYMIISEDYGGRPLYQFNRLGNFKVPVYTNTDYSLRYMPLEADLATAGELLKLNEDKNGDKDPMYKLITLGMVIILALAICFLGWVAYKTSTLPVDLTEGFKQMAQTQSTLTERISGLFDQLNSTVTINTPSQTPTVDVGTVDVNN